MFPTSFFFPPLLFHLLSFFPFFFRFFLVQNRVHDFLVTLGNRDYAKREKREKIELDKLSFGFMLYVFP